MHHLLIFPGQPLFGNRVTVVTISCVMVVTPSECNDRHHIFFHAYMHK